MTTNATAKGKKIIAAISLFSTFFLVSSNVLAGYDLVELDDLQQHEQHQKHETLNVETDAPQQHEQHQRHAQHKRHEDLNCTGTNVINYQFMPEPITDTAVMENIITLTLSGATSYESVEIFHKLLSSIYSIDKLERKIIYLVPDRPQSSRSTWKITTTDQDPFAIESELYGLIKNLDPAITNDSLTGLPFTPTAGDIQEVKSIKPYSATVNTLTFTTGTIIPRSQTAHYYSDDYSPLLYQGFD